jgi:hypothetical protein
VPVRLVFALLTFLFVDWLAPVSALAQTVSDGRYFGQARWGTIEGEVKGGFFVLDQQVALSNAAGTLSCGSGFSLSSRIKILPDGSFDGVCSTSWTRGGTSSLSASGRFPYLNIGNSTLNYMITLIPGAQKEDYLRDRAAGRVAITYDWRANANYASAVSVQKATAAPVAAQPSVETNLTSQLRELQQRELEARQREQQAQQRELEARQREEEARRREAELQRQLAEARAAAAAAAAAASTASPAPTPSPAKVRNTRHALVVGIDRYQSITPLRNAVADARSIAQSLQQSGYSVRQHVDLNERGFKQAVRDFRAQIQQGDEVIFFYAGHGIQLQSQNFLLPADVRDESETQIRDESILLQRVLEDIDEAKPSFTLVIIDACRDNPFRGKARSVGGRGLSPTSAATGQMIIFSAGANQQALDQLGPNDPVSNSVFTRVLLTEMAKPGVPVDRVARNVRQEVVRLARSVGHEQVPAVYDQSIGEFFLTRR